MIAKIKIKIVSHSRISGNTNDVKNIFCVNII